MPESVSKLLLVQSCTGVATQPGHPSVGKAVGRSEFKRKLKRKQVHRALH